MEISFEDSGKTILMMWNCPMAKCEWKSTKIKIYSSIMLWQFKKALKITFIRLSSSLIKTVKKRNFNYWTYATNEEIQFDNLVKIIKLPLNETVPESFLSDMAPLWRIQFAEIGEKTKIK